jgi:hypothetical protein
MTTKGRIACERRETWVTVGTAPFRERFGLLLQS